MGKECEHCGTQNPTTANYCRQCGKPCSEPWLRSVTRVTPLMQQWRLLKHRLTRKEVRAILGEPARIEMSGAGSAQSERWTYQYKRPGEPGEPLGGEIDFELPDGTVTAWVEPEWSRLDEGP